MLAKSMNPLRLMLGGLFVFLLGLFIIWKQNQIIYLFGIALLVMSLMLYLKYHQIIYSTFIFLMGIIYLCVEDVHLFLAMMSACLIFLMHACIHFITFLLHYKNNSWDFIQELIYFIFYLFFAVLIFIKPTRIILLIGIYFILYGLCDIKEAIFEHYHIQLKSYIRHKVRIQLPVILSVLIPIGVLKAINGLDEQKNNIYTENKQATSSNIEVLIHMTPSGYSALGHVDVCINGYVITYGNYDASSYRLFDAIGEGVLMVVKKEQYIEFCKRDTNKTLVGFGLSVSDKKMIDIRNRIRSIFNLLYIWECDYKKAERINDVLKMKQSLKYYANRIYKATGARMYKFKKSKFKTYFVFTTNCVLLADTILEKAGVDLLGINGIITPGTYYDYLNREFMKDKSFVVSRTVYQ